MKRKQICEGMLLRMKWGYIEIVEKRLLWCVVQNVAYDNLNGQWYEVGFEYRIGWKDLMGGQV